MLRAVATSAAVLLAGVAGASTAPVAGAAAFGTCLIAAVSTRHSRPLAEPLRPWSAEGAGAVIAAPRASEVAGQRAGRSDAA